MLGFLTDSMPVNIYCRHTETLLSCKLNKEIKYVVNSDTITYLVSF